MEAEGVWLVLPGKTEERGEIIQPFKIIRGLTEMRGHRGPITGEVDKILRRKRKTIVRENVTTALRSKSSAMQ